MLSDHACSIRQFDQTAAPLVKLVDPSLGFGPFLNLELPSTLGHAIRYRFLRLADQNVPIRRSARMIYLTICR